MLNFILLAANPQIDFILPTCPGIPDPMWIASGRIISNMCGFSLKLLGAGFLTKLLFGGLLDSTTHGRVDVAAIIRLIGKTVFLFLFINYIKRIAFTFEIFIDELCPRLPEVMSGFQSSAKIDGFPTGFRFWWELLKGIFAISKAALAFVTVEGAISLMNYFKSIQLIFLCIVGPLSAGLSLFPIFSKSFSTWLKSYITVSFQAFTLEVFSILSATTFIVDTADMSASPSHLMISIIMVFAIFLTPLWTSMFINSVMTPNLMGAVGQGLQSMARGIGAIPRMMKFFK